MTKIRRYSFFIIVTIIITLNYAHGFLPQLFNPEDSNISYFEYLEAVEAKYGASIPNKILVTLIYPGAFIGKLVHDIIRDPGLKPWPRIPRKEKKMMVYNSAEKSAELFF